jgi:hypothetical protein
VGSPENLAPNARHGLRGGRGRSRKRTRKHLPRRINAIEQQSVELQKEAKGLLKR